jgi:hypothetical protein
MAGVRSLVRLHGCMLLLTALGSSIITKAYVGGNQRVLRLLSAIVSCMQAELVDAP